MTLRVVFMGSPDFALPTLAGLAAHYTVVGVVTQPDRPAGRGRTLTPPPVKTLAEQLGIAVMQPERLRAPDAFAQLAAWQPDLIVVAAFGQILRQNVLELAPHGCLNVHASLLPRWRGAAPIQAAILAGDQQSGVTIMKMDAGIDTGDILAQRATDLTADETAGSLSERLARMGVELLLDTLPGWLAGTVQPVSQENVRATYAAMLKKEDGELNVQETAEQLERRVRAFQPWPGTSLRVGGEVYKVLRAHVVRGTLPPGRTGVMDHLPVVGTTQDCLALDVLQPAGKKAMDGRAFLLGARNWMSEAA